LSKHNNPPDLINFTSNLQSKVGTTVRIDLNGSQEGKMTFFDIARSVNAQKWLYLFRVFIKRLKQWRRTCRRTPQSKNFNRKEDFMFQKALFLTTTLLSLASFAGEMRFKFQEASNGVIQFRLIGSDLTCVITAQPNLLQ
jgi:hypothetical protein